MSFARLIVCVDNSSSMKKENKLVNAKQLIRKMVKEFDCDTKYFCFDENLQKLSAKEFKSLQTGRGTEIEDTLNKLFNNHFRKWVDGKNTKFVFVTDAIDKISDWESVQEAKKRCIKAYGGKLDCECILTGNAHGCRKYLEKIFGDEAFHHCTDKNFQQRLQDMTGGISKANTISRDILPNIESEIDNLKRTEGKQNEQMSKDMRQIVDGLEEVIKKTDAAQQKASAVKSEIARLNAQTATIISNADSATGEAEMERAEEAIEQQTKSYQSQYTNINQAGVELNEAAQALQKEGKKADQMAKELSQKADAVSQQAQVIISNVIKTIKELTNITTGAYQQVKHLKAEFNKQLSDLLTVVSQNDSLMKEFEGVKDRIKNSFVQLRRQRTDLDDFKKEIASHIKSLNMALGRLDDRF